MISKVRSDLPLANLYLNTGYLHAITKSNYNPNSNCHPEAKPRDLLSEMQPITLLGQYIFPLLYQSAISFADRHFFAVEIEKSYFVNAAIVFAKCSVPI